MAFLSWLFGKPSESSSTNSGGTTTAGSPEAVNLRRWRESGEALRWVQARGGKWNHDDWVALLEQLRGSAYWPMEPDAVGYVLEELKQQVTGS